MSRLIWSAFMSILVSAMLFSKVRSASIPYDVIVLDSSAQTLVQVNMDTGEQVITPSPDGYPEDYSVLAARDDGSVFLMHRNAWCWIPCTSTLLQFTPGTGTWESIERPWGFEAPKDMEVTPEGNLVISNSELGVARIDIPTGELQPVPGLSGHLDSYTGVEVDSVGSVIIEQYEYSLEVHVVRRAKPESDDVETIVLTPQMGISSFALETDDTLLAHRINDISTIYRVGLETGDVEAVYDYEGARIRKIALAPDERLIASRLPRELGHLTRIDMTTGVEETVVLENGYHVDDFDILLMQTPSLQPGDADMDLDFGQSDLVQVQQSGKYLTGQTATWGEGDWNGAPGGSQGSPPAGDGVFDQLDIVAALQSGTYLTGPYAVMQGSASFDASLAEPALVHVPEPNAAAMFICGLCLTLGSFRRRQQRPAA